MLNAKSQSLRSLAAIRENVGKWFQGFGYFCDERTRLPVRGRANVLQRRMFAHYRCCCQHDKPCRMVVLKYRRAGSSTASAAILYTHAQNYHARHGAIGTDYKASSNMLAMIKHFGQHDHFPGWDTNHDLWSENQIPPAGGRSLDAPTLPTHWGADETAPSTPSVGPAASASDETLDVWSENPSVSTSDATSILHPGSCDLHPATSPRSENPFPTPQAKHPLPPSYFILHPSQTLFEKNIATQLVWPHGSSIELYTASNPESARSAGLSGYHATECGRWPAGGQLDAGETITSMRNALPKSGFHVAIEESTANGAQGAFYDTCRAARWPDYDEPKEPGRPAPHPSQSRTGTVPLLDSPATNSQPSTAHWFHQWTSDWPLEKSTHGSNLQFVFIFAAWFEDERHVEPLTPQAAKDIEDTVDGAAWYDGERELIARYGRQGPRGLRLGGEVDATVWEQLAWRRGIIANVCTRRGLEEFKQEYPSNPLEAFRSSGSAVFDADGLIALEEMRRQANPVEFGNLELPRDGNTGAAGVQWRTTREREATIWRWETPVEGGKYLIAVDTKENSEIIKGSGELDRNAVLVLRDAWQDERQVWHPAKLVARVAAPNQWDDAPLARLIAPLAKYYGDCLIVVENNKGLALITRLRDEHRCRLYCSEHWDAVRQATAKTYGWRTHEGSRRQMVSTGQEYIRDQRLELLDAHAIAELKSFVFDTRGKATAASGAHDDDVFALLIGLCCLHQATLYRRRRIAQAKPVDEHLWRAAYGGLPLNYE